MATKAKPETSRTGADQNKIRRDGGKNCAWEAKGDKMKFSWLKKVIQDDHTTEIQQLKITTDAKLKHKDAHIAKLEEEIQESKTSTNTSLKENNLQISELNKRVTELISQSALRLHEKYQQITALSRGVAEQEARLARRTQNFEDVQVQLDIHEKQVQDWQAREGKHQKNTREKVQSVSDKFRLREPRMQQLFHNVKSLQKQLATLGQPKQEYHPREKAEFEQLKDVVEDIQAQLKEKHDVQNSNQSQVEGLDKRIEDIQHQLSVHQEKEQESRIRDQDHIHDLSQQIKEVQTELSTQNTNSATMSRDETSTPAIVKTGLDSLEINVSKVKTKVSSFVLPTIHQHGEDIAELQFQMKELYPLKAADTKELEDTSKVKPSVRKGEVPLSETDDEIQSGKKRKPDVELGSAVKVARHRASNRKAFIPIPVVDNSDDSDYVPPLETTITGYPSLSRTGSCVGDESEMDTQSSSEESDAEGSDSEEPARKRGHHYNIRTMPTYARTSSSPTRSSLTHVANMNLPPSILDCVEATIKRAETGRRFTFGERNINRCVHTTFQSEKPAWPKGEAAEAACRICTKNRYGCLLVTKDKSLVLLPLARELRDGMSVNTEAYWRLEEGVEVPKDIWKKWRFS